MRKIRPNAKLHNPKPRRKPKQSSPTDELGGALRSMVREAEIAGGRDRPEVARAKEILARHTK